MNGFLCAATLLLLTTMAGCGSAGLFSGNSIPESPGVAEAPWPKLVDTPPGLAPGSYDVKSPDPAIGIATTADLGQVARDAASRAETLSQPVLTDAERRRLKR